MSIEAIRSVSMAAGKGVLLTHAGSPTRTATVGAHRHVRSSRSRKHLLDERITRSDPKRT